ncbi:hypothetical protein Efla_000147 [Eimeria flavescens]
MCRQSAQRRVTVCSSPGKTSADDTPGNSGRLPGSADRPRGVPGSVGRGALRQRKRNTAARAQAGIRRTPRWLPTAQGSRSPRGCWLPTGCKGSQGPRCSGCSAGADGCAGGGTADADAYVASSRADGCQGQIKRCRAVIAPAPCPGTRPASGARSRGMGSRRCSARSRDRFGVPLGDAGNVREVAEVSQEICVIKALVGYLGWQVLDVLGHQGFRAKSGLGAEKSIRFAVRGCRPQTDACGADHL